MKIGDVSRSRRFADPVRQRWYAYHRAVRFAQRMRQTRVAYSGGSEDACPSDLPGNGTTSTACPAVPPGV